jgi:nucleotide-binding universal stress UspA family protein
MKKIPTTQKTLSDSGALGSGAFHSLLVAVDLTASTDRVLGRVSRLPLAEDARVTLLHVVPGSLPQGDQRRAVRDATKALMDEVRHLRQSIHKTIRIEPLVKVGAAAKEIATLALTEQVELIVMGRGGGRALRDAILGSTAERVIRQAKRPVLVVRLAARAAYARPALALALDQAAQGVVRHLLRVLPRPPPRVEVIHAYEVPYRGLIYPSLSEEDAEERKDELRSHASREVANLLSTALAEADVRPQDRPHWAVQVRCGSPRTIVEKAIKNAETDLLVLGTRGYSGATYVFLGTVAGDLLRAAKCDVLIVPPLIP